MIKIKKIMTKFGCFLSSHYHEDLQLKNFLIIKIIKLKIIIKIKIIYIIIIIIILDFIFKIIYNLFYQ